MDEARFQEIIREYARTDHHKTQITAGQIWEMLPEVVYYAEAGLNVTFDAVTYLLSSLVHESGMKAVLTGQGSDEFFYGYAGYTIDLFRKFQKMSPEERQYNERLWGAPDFRYHWNYPAMADANRRLYSQDVRAEWNHFSALLESPVRLDRLRGLNPMKRRSYLDCKLQLSGLLLTEHGDHMAFAHSVEARHPFLDPELIDFVMKIPDRYKLNGTNEKYILKKASEGIVPEEIIHRKKFPLQGYTAAALMKDPAGKQLLDWNLIRKQGVFDERYVRELADRYSEGNFKLRGVYEIDYLLIVLTVTMLCQQYSLSL